MSKGTFAGRFVVPLHNPTGALVGYAGCVLDEETEPRYLFPSAEKGFRKSYLLFNLHRVLSESASEPVVVVEGFFDCMKVKQAGYACVGLLGSSLSKQQEDLLSRHFRRVVLLFDGDEAGKKGEDECLMSLGRRAFVKAVSVPAGKQPRYVLC